MIHSIRVQYETLMSSSTQFTSVSTIPILAFFYDGKGTNSDGILNRKFLDETKIHAIDCRPKMLKLAEQRTFNKSETLSVYCSFVYKTRDLRERCQKHAHLFEIECNC